MHLLNFTHFLESSQVLFQLLLNSFEFIDEISIDCIDLFLNPCSRLLLFFTSLSVNWSIGQKRILTVASKKLVRILDHKLWILDILLRSHPALTPHITVTIHYEDFLWGWKVKTSGSGTELFCCKLREWKCLCG